MNQHNSTELRDFLNSRKNKNMSKNKPHKEKVFRQYRSNQGRSPRQMEGSYKAMSASIIGAVITLSIVSILQYFGINLN